MLSRRTFLASLAISTASIQRSLAVPTPERFAVSTWSFHNYFPNTRYGKPEFKLEDWNLKKVVETIKSGLEITHIEVSSAHLGVTNPAEIYDLAAFMKDKGCKFIHMSDNMKGVNLAQQNEQKRKLDLKRFEELITYTKMLEIPTMRVNTGTPENKDWDIKTTIEQYKQLTKYAKQYDVEIIIENHFGISADPKNVVRIIEEVGGNISSCPDFGLFKSEEERATGLPLMFKHAKRVCSAKFHGILEDQQTKDFNLKKCYELMKQVQYPGWISFEYEGPLEPLLQLQRMKKLATTWLNG